MSSIGQSILMALTVTVNKYTSSNVQAVRRNDTKRDSLTADLGRRNLLFSSSSFLAAALTTSDQLLQKYLKKTEENKTKNDKERLDSYYKRNYKDYFEFVEGSIKGKTEAELSESEKRILEWLKSNK
uniref:Photosystem I reaction center subunit N, chloroplastic n=2 Tax=Noccaea caerulescens TaxID=107243 RepID=A0A1J3DRM1_NOCCA